MRLKVELLVHELDVDLFHKLVALVGVEEEHREWSMEQLTIVIAR